MRYLCVALACAVACDRATPSDPAPAPVPRDAAVVWPEPKTSDDDVLEIPSRELQPGKYELHLGQGVIVLQLAESSSLVAPDPHRGELALQTLAKWLKQPVPIKTHSQPLQPVAFEALDMGDGDHKVFFTTGAEYAEMYINIKDSTHVEFVPKDSGYAGGLISIFADALRDGPEPPRTKANDPNLESDEPLFGTAHPFAFADGHDVYCTGDGWSAFRADSAHETLVHAPWGGKIKKVCELPGAVDQIGVGLHSSNAIAIVTARDPRSGVIGGGMSASLWNIDASGCHRIALPAGIHISPFERPVLSPDGTQVALTDKSDVVVFPVAKGPTTRAHVHDLSLIYAWDADGIELHDLSGGRQRLVPGQPATDTDDATSTSPDGAYTAVVRKNSLDILDRTKHTTAHFTPHVRGDIRAIERALSTPLTWVAPHRLILRGAPDIALDAATLRSRPLAKTGTFLCASTDGAHALFDDGHDHVSESP